VDLAEPSPTSIARQSRVADVGREATCAVVRVRGEHDISTVAELSAVLYGAAVLADDGLVVDLGEVSILDASTIGVIVACCNALGLQGRSLTIRSPAKPARRLLDICGLQSILDPRELVRPSPALTRGAAPGATPIGRYVST
jgi:anti-anti-sigma factor